MSHHKMQGIRAELKRSNRSKSTGCRTLCCTNCRFSVSSLAEEVESSRSDRYTSMSSLAHYLVQERLDQMIKENEDDRARRLMEARKRKQKWRENNATTSRSSSGSRRLLVVVATEKSTHDPREELRRSMMEVILANRIQESKDLRYLLNCYISVNSEECKAIILEVFYQVCNEIFFCCKCH